MEIAHWCRYLKECCAFYGQRMKPNMVVYTGLNCKLLFDSLMQHFECPLSTTVDDHIANRFAEGTTGVILKLKAANPKTRYFDVSRFSQFPDERERLFMGSSLKIVDIFINFNESNHYISGIQMLEQVLNGQFIDGNAKAERRLLSLLESVVGLSILEQIVSLVRNANDKSHDCGLEQFLKDEEYDTDSIIQDVDSGTILCNLETILTLRDKNTIMKKIKRLLSRLPSKYVTELFVNFMDKIKEQNKIQSIWINHNSLNQKEHESLRSMLYGDGGLFDHFSINKSNIKHVQQYEWTIENETYQKLLNTKSRSFIESP
eukprot:415269_1